MYLFKSLIVVEVLKLPKKKHVCEECGKILASTSSLRSHMTNVHNSYQWPCEHCGKIFLSSAYLKSHLQSHNKEPCTICGKLLGKY